MLQQPRDKQVLRGRCNHWTASGVRRLVMSTNSVHCLECFVVLPSTSCSICICQLTTPIVVDTKFVLTKELDPNSKGLQQLEFLLKPLPCGG